MLTIDEALKQVLDHARPLPPRRRPLGEAIGCFLAEDVTADRDLPPFDKALVDGYAVRAADLANGAPRSLRIGEEIMAGQTPTRPLAPGEAALIMTGAPLPSGADAVVMLEHTGRPEPDIVVLNDEPVSVGKNRLPRGREMRAGDLLLRQGDLLSPVRLGLLASIGRTEVQVVPCPNVAVLPTGDELVEPDLVPGPGQIRNSNATLLRSMAQACGVRAEALPIARDELEHLRAALERGLKADVLLVAGGVSAGQRDLVPATLEALGVTAVFHKVRLKPGKPLWFGIGPARGDCPGSLVFGLPGNPVSGVVGFLLFVRPALEILWGKDATPVVNRRARLASPFVHRGDRSTYHPSRWIEGKTGSEPLIEPLDWAGSADLRAVAQADGFAVFPAGDHHYSAGDTIEFLDLL
ncbi:MAG TPA: gephyrin-like molybdotransferase Glp [Isosphaeraceae bacterium]|jgi:molybdopterin molybdotransferase|nr:gephyrin-like molybdotransferase Glp [Isosphaeraceae bacterium]